MIETCHTCQWYTCKHSAEIVNHPANSVFWEPPTSSHRMLNASKCYFLDSLISCKSNCTSILIKLLLEQLRICVRLIILCCWRECHKGIRDHEGILHNIRIMFTNSAHMCSWLSTSRKSKVHFQIVQILSSLGYVGIFLFLLSFLYQIVDRSHVEYINEVFNSSPLVQWVHYESMTLMIIPTVLNAFEQLLVHMLPHSPWQELRLLVAANVLASKLWDRYSGWGPECEFLRQTTSKYIDHGFLEPETRTCQYILCLCLYKKYVWTMWSIVLTDIRCFCTRQCTKQFWCLLVLITSNHHEFWAVGVCRLVTWWMVWMVMWPLDICHQSKANTTCINESEMG